MAIFDQWTVLRQAYRSLDESREMTRRTRAARNDTSFCPVLDFLERAPDRTMHDMLRVEAFLYAHAEWGPWYCQDVILTTGWYVDRFTTAVVQRGAIDALLSLHPEGVVKMRLHQILTTPDFRFEAADGVDAIVDWLSARHHNAKAFFAQADVLRHVPAGRDLTDAPVAAGFFDIDVFNGGRCVVRGQNETAHECWRAESEALALDYEQLQALSRGPVDGALEWLHQQSAAGDQRRFQDLTARDFLPALIARINAIGADIGLRDRVRFTRKTTEAEAADAMVIVMDACVDHFAANPGAELIGAVGSLTAWLLQEHALVSDTAHAREREAEVRTALGLSPHFAPITAP